jgi:D-erythro-7,8-dihydroneopterin triphosphate epimerase
VIGANEWERKTLQDIIINVEITFDGCQAAQSDDLDDTVNYKTICKKIIKEVENSQFYLLEKLTDHILNIVLEDSRVQHVVVEVDKPHALRFADSVSITSSSTRK